MADRGSCDPRTDPEAPLPGGRVLELGSLIAGTFAGRFLADCGSEVVKVEDPHRPNPLREWGKRNTGTRAVVGGAEWNQQLVTLDLRTAG